MAACVLLWRKLKKCIYCAQYVHIYLHYTALYCTTLLRTQRTDVRLCWRQLWTSLRERTFWWSSQVRCSDQSIYTSTDILPLYIYCYILYHVNMHRYAVSGRDPASAPGVAAAHCSLPGVWGVCYAQGRGGQGRELCMWYIVLYIFYCINYIICIICVCIYVYIYSVYIHLFLQ